MTLRYIHLPNIKIFIKPHLYYKVLQLSNNQLTV